jgi:ABC-type dipeptide/oligopeptide/nickel transport system permease component
VAVFLVRRITQAAFVVLCVAIVIFFIMRLIPGDPARLMAPRASEEALAAIRVQLGLNEALPVQFIRFLGNAVRGDFGNSYYEQSSALSLILERLPKTLLLTGLAMGMAIVIGVPLGILAAVRRDTFIDRLILSIQMLLQSAPNFWLALVLLLVVAVNLRWLPAIGFSGLQSAILPATALAIGLIAVISRVVRSSMIEILEQDMVKALKARGIPGSLIVWKHGLKNALLPLLTLTAAQVGYLIGGAVVVEFIFNYPGIGLLTLNAVLRRDFPLVQAVVIVASGILVSINLLVDLSYGLIDPRVRQRA